MDKIDGFVTEKIKITFVNHIYTISVRFAAPYPLRTVLRTFFGKNTTFAGKYIFERLWSYRS